MVPPAFLALFVGLEVGDLLEVLRHLEGDRDPFHVRRARAREDVRPEAFLANSQEGFFFIKIVPYHFKHKMVHPIRPQTRTAELHPEEELVLQREEGNEREEGRYGQPVEVGLRSNEIRKNGEILRRYKNIC